MTDAEKLIVANLLTAIWAERNARQILPSKRGEVEHHLVVLSRKCAVGAARWEAAESLDRAFAAAQALILN
jgi:hypothetical protein